MFDNLPPPAECLAILVGCAEVILFGIGGLSDHKAWAEGYGVEVDTPEDGRPLTKSQKVQKGLIQALAARNIQNGVLLLTLALYTRERTALGFAVLYGTITTLADTLIVKNCGRPELVPGHAVGVFNSLAIGSALLYWGRNDPWPWNRK